MANKSLTLILVLCFVFVFISAYARPSTNMLRGLKPVATDTQTPSSKDPGSHFNVALDPKDPKFVELGKFSIDEENKKAESKLNFGGVLKAVYGRHGDAQMYALVIGASDATGSNEYYAYVSVDQDSKELVAFIKKN
ncbi:uncharacterized protein LOC142538464 [Primulina tabacum]|uniref:uncharacterized protein LOC142538464 n=1 Tax=Primulina tabacum TaxID=48773 RepID=UPI003F5ABB84